MGKDKMNQTTIPIANEGEDEQVTTTAQESLEKLKKDEVIDIALTQREIILEREADIKERDAKITELDAKIVELTGICKRVQADFDNHRRRNSEALRNARVDGAVEVIERFIPMLDIIDQALAMIKDEQVASGIKMMQRQIMEVFSTQNVSEIEALDTDFDPNLHEAVMTEENKEKSGKVLEVLRKGYKMGDKIIRYAAVKVAN